jgi:hypothetical protein
MPTWNGGYGDTLTAPVFAPTGPHPGEIVMEPALTQVIELAIALVMAVIALVQNRQKGEVIAFFDPENDIVTSPPSSVPARSWKMDDVTKKWLCAGHSPEEQASLLQQVADDQVNDTDVKGLFLSFTGKQLKRTPRTRCTPGTGCQNSSRSVVS